MATWQFDFHLVPRITVERQYGGVPVTLSKDDYDETNWWDGIDPRPNVEGDLSVFLTQGRAWDSQQLTWGTEDGDRVDVSYDGDRIAEVYGRIDMRNVSLTFIYAIVELARRHGLLVVTEGRHVLRPSVKELLRATSRSPSFVYVSDPEDFLRRLVDED